MQCVCRMSQKSLEAIIRAQLRANTTVVVTRDLNLGKSTRAKQSLVSLLFPLIKWIGLHRGNAISCQI